jgi:hypothetical protein
VGRSRDLESGQKRDELSGAYAGVLKLKKGGLGWREFRIPGWERVDSRGPSEAHGRLMEHQWRQAGGCCTYLLLSLWLLN